MIPSRVKAKAFTRSICSSIIKTFHQQIAYRKSSREHTRPRPLCIHVSCTPCVRVCAHYFLPMICTTSFVHDATIGFTRIFCELRIPFFSFPAARRYCVHCRWMGGQCYDLHGGNGFVHIQQFDHLNKLANETCLKTGLPIFSHVEWWYCREMERMVRGPTLSQDLATECWYWFNHATIRGTPHIYTNAQYNHEFIWDTRHAYAFIRIDAHMHTTHVETGLGAPHQCIVHIIGNKYFQIIANCQEVNLKPAIVAGIELVHFVEFMMTCITWELRCTKSLLTRVPMSPHPHILLHPHVRGLHFPD